MLLYINDKKIIIDDADTEAFIGMGATREIKAPEKFVMARSLISVPYHIGKGCEQKTALIDSAAIDDFKTMMAPGKK
jgi:hypothetical protein